MPSRFWQLDDAKARLVLVRFGEPALIKGEVYQVVFIDPTSREHITRADKGFEVSRVAAAVRQPQIYLHKSAGEFEEGDQVRVLCRESLPDFFMGSFEFNEGWLYRVPLHPEQPKPIDSSGRGWQ